MDEFLDSESSYQRLLSDYKKYGSLCVGVDFDQTLYDSHNNNKSYEMVRQLVRDLYKANCKIIIWTAHNDHEFVSSFLKSIDIQFEGINIDGVSLGWSSRKPFFNILIDDRAGILEVYNQLVRLLKEIKEIDNK